MAALAARTAGRPRPACWLTRVVGRLALDELRSARVRRESYVGPWLPEPEVSREPDPADVVVTDESLRLAFLVVLEALTPEQRVAFVLHDVLDVPFEDVAEVLDCSPVAARQLASRARRHVRAAAPPPLPPAAQVRAAIDALAQALGTGDVPALSRLLREDVTLVADGGGHVAAAGRPLQGDEVARFLLGVVERHGVRASVEAVLVNGEPGFLVHVPPGGPRIASLAAYTVAVTDGRIAAIHVVLAPGKLSRLPG